MADNFTRLDGIGDLRGFRSTEKDNYHTPHSIVEALPVQHVDAFSRLRTANPGYRFDSQLTYQIDDDLWDTLAAGDGTIVHDGTNRKATLTAGATAGVNTATLQSHYHAPYTPGRSQLIFITFAMPGTVPTNGERGVGYYDGTNGIYLKEDNTNGVILGLATTTDHGSVETLQADWNIDRMDGGGPSGKLLDTTKTNILAIQMQALYVGRVTVGFDIDGQFFPVHAFDHANIASDPYVAVASLPVRYWASTSTAATSCVIDAICSSVISEGGDRIDDMPGRLFVSEGAVDNAASGTLIVIRSKQQLNSINQHAVVLPILADVSVEDTGCWIELRRNATVTAGTFTDVGGRSTVECSYAGNPGTDPVVTAGTGDLIDKFWIPASAQRGSRETRGLVGKAILCYSHLLSTADNISVIFNEGAATSDLKATLKWIEIR